MNHPLLAAIGSHYVDSVPLDVGFEFSGSGSGNDDGRFLWCDANPLNATGTITTVNANFASAGITIAFALISPANVIRSISANTTSVSGVSTYAVSLAGEAGDYIGVWGAANVQPRYTATIGVTLYRNTTTAKPGPGDARSPASTGFNRALWIYGTN